MEYKRARLEDILADDDARLIEGYASTFGGRDTYGDTIVKGAYKGTLKEDFYASNGLPMYYEHESRELVGRWTFAEEDEKGLRVRGELTPNHSRANDVYASFKAGHIDGLSIGFSIPPGGAVERSDGGRTIQRARLHEISVVGRPADHGARGMLIKAHEQTEREFERLLLRAMRDAGAEFSRSQAIALMRDGFKGLIATRDAGGRQDAEPLASALLHAIRTARG